jgi:molybdopterin-guanine dinucleotide biosynthesis protein A
MAFILDDYDIILNQNVHFPILGLYSTFKELKKLRYQKVFVFSCDNPLFSYEVIDYMIKESSQYDCYMPKWNNGFREPLFAIYPVEKAYKTSLINLKQKQYKLTKIIGEDWTVNYVSIEQKIKLFDQNLLSFKNINKPGDIKTLEPVFDKNK